MRINDGFRASSITPLQGSTKAAKVVHRAWAEHGHHERTRHLIYFVDYSELSLPVPQE